MWLEGLETRMLLSAASPAPVAAELSGVYGGTLVATSGSVILGVPYRQQISITFSPTGSDALGGTIAVQSMGSASLSGAARGRQFTAVFGDNDAGAGAITGAAERNGVITGTFREIIGGNTMTGVFRVGAGGSAVAASPLASSAASSSSTTTNESVLSGKVRLRGAGYAGFAKPATLDITGGTSGGVITGTFDLDNNTFTLDGISSRKTLTFVLSGPGSGYGSATLGASGVALSGTVTADLPNGTVSGPFVVFQPANNGSSGSSTGTGTNQYAVSTLFGSVGGFASPTAAVTNPGATGTSSQPGSSISTLPPSSATGSLLNGTGTGGSILGGTGASSPGGGGNVVDSYNPVPPPTSEAGSM
jgi:hypothetical protein